MVVHTEENGKSYKGKLETDVQKKEPWELVSEGKERVEWDQVYESRGLTYTSC